MPRILVPENDLGSATTPPDAAGTRSTELILTELIVFCLFAQTITR
jgi:hypothetical protein